MGGCSAVYCTNHSQKGSRMFRFPTDEERRKLWITNCGREGAPLGRASQLCIDHFEDSQFEKLCKDKKKLKRNAIPTVFTFPSSPPPKEKKAKKVTPEKKSDLKIKVKVKPDKKAKGEVQNERRVTRWSIKPVVSPKKKRRQVSSSEDDSETDIEEEESEDEAQQQIALLKRESESMKQEIAEFEKHNKGMARVILELEKHNKLMSIKITELDKENQVLTKKNSDLEKQVDSLRQMLNSSFTEEQLARMDKMKKLGTIERYIPVLK